MNHAQRIAKAIGLDTEHLRRFTIQFDAELPFAEVFAMYYLPTTVGDGLETECKRFRLEPVVEPTKPPSLSDRITSALWADLCAGGTQGSEEPTDGTGSSSPPTCGDGPGCPPPGSRGGHPSG